MRDYNVAIVSEALPVFVPGTILYVSDGNVKVTGEKSVKVGFSKEAFEEESTEETIEVQEEEITPPVIEEIQNMKNPSKAQVREKMNNAKNETPRQVELVGLKNRNGKSYFKCEFKYYPAFNYYQETTKE